MKIYDYFKGKYPQLFGEILISFDCGKGWKDLIEETFEKIKDSGVKILQLKEKFGGLRIYVEFSNKEVSDILHAAEDASFKICEGCGTKEGVTVEGGWVKTLCPTCRAKKSWWLEDEELEIISSESETDFFEAVNKVPPVDAREFELAPQEKTNALDEYIDRILKVLGHEEALVTDESKLFDFLFSEPNRIESVSKELGIEVTMGDYLIDIAARLKLKDVTNKVRKGNI